MPLFKALTGLEHQTSL